MQNIESELYKFSSNILILGNQIIDDRIERFEKLIGFFFPKDFKSFMKLHNGLDMMGTEVLSFDVEYSESIENVYYFEHNEVNYPISKHLIPFSNDGRGNFYCLDIKETTPNCESCPIVFWVSNYVYTTDDKPEVVNESFRSWIQQVVIEWTLEDYGYDGEEKEK